MQHKGLCSADDKLIHTSNGMRSTTKSSNMIIIILNAKTYKDYSIIPTGLYYLFCIIPNMNEINIFDIVKLNPSYATSDLTIQLAFQ